MLIFFKVAPWVFENKPMSTRVWSVYDNSINLEKLPIVSTGKMFLGLCGNRAEPISICPGLSLRGINVTGLNEVLIFPYGFGKG